MTIYHLTLAERGRFALARDEAERRALIRILARICGSSLLFFGLADDHLHALLRAARAGRLGEALRRALSALRPDLELKAPHIDRVKDRAHLRRLIDYLIGQPERHGVGEPAALWSGSALPDVLRMRLLPGFDLTNIRSELPRLRQRDLLATVGLDLVPLELATDDDLVRAGPAKLIDLGASVHAVGPALSGRSVEVVQARTLAAKLARSVGFSATMMASLLGVTPRTILRLAARPTDPRAIEYARRRLTLELRVERLGLRALRSNMSA